MGVVGVHFHLLYHGTRGLFFSSTTPSDRILNSKTNLFKKSCIKLPLGTKVPSKDRGWESLYKLFRWVYFSTNQQQKVRTGQLPEKSCIVTDLKRG